MSTRIFCLLLMSVLPRLAFAQGADPAMAEPSEASSQVEDEQFQIDDDEVLDPNAFTAPEEERPPAPPELAPEQGNNVPSPALSDASPSGGFKKPPGPPEGGSIRVPHPNAAKGLLRIEKDGSYQYRTPLLEKNQSTSLRVGYQSTPVISSGRGFTFADVYGGAGLYGLVADYEWMPLRRFGSLGFQLGSGLIMARGNGRFADGSLAEETYSLFVVPATINIVYRFEYVRRQWVVPFVYGGGTVYGLAEVRDDGKTPTFAYSPAVGGGGGIHINVSRWDHQGSFILSSEYGVADLWLTVEARAVQGLDPELDFTNQGISAGVTVDY